MGKQQNKREQQTDVNLGRTTTPLTTALHTPRCPAHPFQTSTLAAAAMSAVHDQENIAEGLSVGSAAKASSLSPKKSGGRKTRSKSIGPGGLDAPLKEAGGNRRKVYSPPRLPTRARIVR